LGGYVLVNKIQATIHRYLLFLDNVKHLVAVLQGFRNFSLFLYDAYWIQYNQIYTTMLWYYTCVYTQVTYAEMLNLK
jgi:hypothetical protein